MRVLVTSASGFIGRALLGGLSRDPTLTIVGASRGSDGLGDRAERVLIGDISGHTDWSSALSGVTSVVHRGARVHVTDDKGADTLALYRRVNVQGTLALARQAARAGVKRLVFLSSIKVNGESTSPCRPFTTNDDPAPQDSYGVSKLEAERGLRALAEKTGLEVVIIRPVLVYGPGVGANFLALMKLIRTGMLLPLGAIDNQRSFLALENLVDFVFASLRHPAAGNKTFLVSDG